MCVCVKFYFKYKDTKSFPALHQPSYSNMHHLTEKDKKCISRNIHKWQ